MRLSFFALLLALLAGATRPATAALRLPRLITDHLVLQRDQPLPLWGWATPGATVRVQFRQQTYTALAGGPAGRWQLTLPPTPAGGPYELAFSGDSSLTVSDVLVGDVWLAAGQSNMAWPVRDAQNAAAEMAAATYPRIRSFGVEAAPALLPQADVAGGRWQPCSPQTVGGFSAVAYYFARDLYRRYQVPIGLLTAAWNGTPAEAWTSAPALRQLPDFAAPVAALPPNLTAAVADFEARTRAWQRSPAGQDQGLRPGAPTWADPAFDATAWPTLQAPGYWEDQFPALHDFDGIVWLRKELTLSAAEAAGPAQLGLARIDDTDSTWVNGVAVGGTHGYYPNRQYAVPVGLLRPGRNVLTVRVVDTGGGGGIWGAAADMYLRTAAGSQPLAGRWQYHPAYDPASQPVNPFPGGPQMAPTTLFNGLIAPLRPFALRGVIWYQGESNVARAAQYRTLFPALIRDWRAQWQRPALPFLFVQIAGYQPSDSSRPVASATAELREAQQLALRLPATGMATALDLGDSLDIHPRNKQAVGARLALAARRLAYADAQVVADGPALATLAVVGRTARLTFRNPGAGLVLKAPGGPLLKGFAIAGADRRFVWATGQLQGNVLVLSSPQVPKPVAVRYGWGNMPFVNLYNRAGLPAPPFRTDTWPGVTEGRK